MVNADTLTKVLSIALEIYIGSLVLYFTLKGVTGWQLWSIKLADEFIHLLLLPAIPILALALGLRLWCVAIIAGINTVAWLLLFGHFITVVLPITPGLLRSSTLL